MMKNKADNLRELAKNTRKKYVLEKVNQAIQEAESTEERLELLVLKCELLEDSVYGYVHS